MATDTGAGNASICGVLSKDARLRIVRLLYDNVRTMRKLAEILGVTPPAVIKYMRGVAHPSDRVVCRAIEVASEIDPALLYDIKDIIRDDVLSSLEAFLRWASNKEVLTRGDIEAVEAALGRYKLLVLGSVSSPLVK